MRKERCGDGCLPSAIVLRRFVGTGDIFQDRLPAGSVLLSSVKDLTSKEVSYIRLPQNLDRDA